MFCKNKQGIRREVHWDYVKRAWVAVITICREEYYPRKIFVYTPPDEEDPVLDGKIYIFANSTYVDYIDDSDNTDVGHEVNNLVATLSSLGFNSHTFIDIDAEEIESVLNDAGETGILIIPELEADGSEEEDEEDEDTLNDVLSDEAKELISDWVYYDGGALIVCDPSSGSMLEILNSIFGFELEPSGVSEPITLTEAGLASSIFESASSTIEDNNATSCVLTSSLPEGGTTIYVGDDETQSVVTLINYGLGSILILGWDWYDAEPIGVRDNGWIDVLRLFVETRIEPRNNIQVDLSAYFNFEGMVEDGTVFEIGLIEE